MLPLSEKFLDNKNVKNLIDKDKFYSLNKSVVGESSNSKIDRVVNLLNKKKIENLFVSAGENVCWLLNIRGKDLPNSPVANSHSPVANSHHPEWKRSFWRMRMIFPR